MRVMEYWCLTFETYGWSSIQMLGDDKRHAMNDEMHDPRRLSIGIPHPHYGVMRASVHLTHARSLTRLVSLVRASMHELPQGTDDLPRLFVGDRVFTDVIHGEERSIPGVLVYKSAAVSSVECAPMTVVQWYEGGPTGTKGPWRWLPYFEDVNDWVMTGWDALGGVHEIFKPVGWGCRAMGSAQCPAPSLESVESNM